jgi:tRNA threonylcarbamoyladenosine dehydratase
MTLHCPVDPASFYAELTVRNRGFVRASTQRRLGTATILVAGCGSTGGAVVDPLVRLGAQHFLLADNGAYELNNLNRQHATVADLGRNKAEVSAERVKAVNPHAATTVLPDGITASNVRPLVRRSDVIIDGVDVTERSGWVAKYLLHEAAAGVGRPVVSGYDMAGTQYVRFYGYRRGDRPFGGRVTRCDLDVVGNWDLLRRVVPLRVVPLDMLEHARRQLGSSDEAMPQLVHASLLFGAVAARMTLHVLEGRAVRRHTVINVDAEVQKPATNLQAALRKPVVAALALRDLAALRHREETR